MSESWSHGFLESNGIKLHYVTRGEGPLMLMLHGFPAFWYAWKYHIPEFASSYKVVALDLPGYNDSDKPTEFSAYRVENLVGYIEGAIDALGYKHCVLVGHDWGGALAWTFTYDRPERVERLVVMNFPHPAKFAQGLRTPQQLLRSSYILFFQLRGISEFVIRQGNYAFIGFVFEEVKQYNPDFTSEDIQTFRTAAARPGALTAMLNYYRNLPNSPFLKRQWGQLEVPTLLLWGEQDNAFGKELSYGTEAYVKDFQLHYIPNSGHWVQLDRPQQVSQHLRDFLA
ncbi:alpha/beta fold hydrolase [Synechococcus sp. PCC 7336]|uniref:alpha/beta fold hydrolase n=1 Tax=Synechococcus sp. PCC 7336 TaxID=195250 RepID=UPI00034C054B|nr:alpha/beta hydrolase [Synechococcus sp. PCC 7336]